MTAAWRIGADGDVARTDDDPAPSPDVGDVVIAVEGAWIDRAGARDPSRTPGGAAVGTVVAAGEQALPLLGARVLVGRHVPCGECDHCLRGGAAICPRGGTLGVDRRGTLAERITIPARLAVDLSGELAIPGPAAAAVGGDLAIAYAMYARANLAPREPVAIVGDDPIAGFLAQVLRAKSIDPTAPIDDTRPRVVFVTAPTAESMSLALSHLTRRSTLIVRASAAFDLVLPPRVLSGELTLHTVAGAHPDLLVEIAALVVRGDVSLASVRAVALADLATAIDPATSLVAVLA
jgi:D-arabinose 1-dehydrogenase-like Zn-dependent alcohol dehydrogenase